MAFVVVAPVIAAKADVDQWQWLVDTRLIKVVMIILVMLPISLLRNISMLEKVNHYNPQMVCLLLISYNENLNALWS